MRAQLLKAWASRAPRERTVIVILMVIMGAALYVWLVQSGGREHSRLRASVPALRAQAARLEQQAAELERLRATPATPASQTDLRALVQAQADAAGLSHALVKIDAPDANQVGIVFGAVVFADWLNWVASLKSQQVRLDTCRIETLSTPGMVSVTATLLRVKHP
ncbi:type II secretion system protein M [Sulfuricella sp.]|uniref:type II secretion system protein M n=1 Tax=Sulfuricella sp. TaxID=2099377 RepID=UPI002BD87AD6|nr:type II secretion system protein M [Sulfuricella sp.]HUX65133.1 type II secretion system protein M [Sulfuricella sp.]